MNRRIEHLRAGAGLQLSYGRTLDNAGRTTKTEDRPSAQLTSSTVFPTGSASFYNVTNGYTVGLPLDLPTTDGLSPSSNGFSYSAEYDLATSSSTYGVGAGGAFAGYTYTRDTAGRITNINATQNVITPTFRLDMGYAYFANGQLKQDPEGTYTYDARGLVATRVVASGTYSFQYDQLGRNSEHGRFRP